ncbi:MAG: DJ-1/PfpI family protein [candidate division Zixibacteria bacterium]|nr:DJ-1/PfpI family protein [candidate division Zixibacteria bacterium]
MKRILFFLLMLILSFGLTLAQEEKPFSGKKVVMIVAPKDFRDEELLEPMTILLSKGAEVVIASSSLDTAIGMLGAKMKPEILVSNIKTKDWDAIVLVGGQGAKQYWNDKVLHTILKDAVKEDKIIGAICIAPVTLANAGILKGKKATVYEGVADKLKSKGANYTNSDVEQDGKIITANGPKAAGKFAEVLVETLSKAKSKGTDKKNCSGKGANARCPLH